MRKPRPHTYDTSPKTMVGLLTSLHASMRRTKALRGFLPHDEHVTLTSEAMTDLLEEIVALRSAVEELLDE